MATSKKGGKARKKTTSKNRKIKRPKNPGLTLPLPYPPEREAK